TSTPTQVPCAPSWNHNNTNLSAGAARVVLFGHGNGRVIDFDGRAEPPIWPAPGGGDRNAALSPDGLRLSIATEGDTDSGSWCRILDLTRRDAPVERSSLTARTGSFEWQAFGPDSRTLASIGVDKLSLWDTKTGRLLRQTSAELAGRPVWSPDGR